ncbi:MAG: protein kinase domain-containing protein [Candidatus Xenobia bacterium]
MLIAGAVLQDRYTIEGVIGQGGMGVVYRARMDRLGGRPVAVKAMTFRGVDGVERDAVVGQFVREATLLASLEHPGLVHVTDFFEEGGDWYLVMTLVEGRTLHELCFAESGFLPTATVLSWTDRIADVLEYLHLHKPPIIFRDLKPSNAMLDHSGRVRLIDFGIAKVNDGDTDTATLIKSAGSAGYAAPEQYAMGTSDARTDIFALGATCWTLLTKQIPPPVVRIMMGDVGWTPASQINPEVPPELDAVLARMVAVPKGERFQTVAEARQALREAAGSSSLRLRWRGMAEIFQQAQDPGSRDRQRLEQGLQDLSQQPARPPGRERIVGDLPTGLLEPFVGRRRELAALRESLDARAARLVVVVGRSGTGKSALLARGVVDTARPVAYLGLHYAEQRSVETLIEMVAQALPTAEAAFLASLWRGGGALERRLRQVVDRVLVPSRMLVVLDNLEEILDENNEISREAPDLAAFILACLESQEPVQVVAASRRSMLLTPADAARLGDRCYEIPLTEGLPPEDAVALLQALGLREAGEPELRRLAEAAWGMPRTLQTLVGTLRTRRTLTLEKLLADNALLTRVTSDPARELYERLSPPERLVMQVLAIYDRPVPEAGVRWLLPGLAVEDMLEALVRSCAVTCHHDRFSLSPLDAAYASRQTPEDDGPYSRAALNRQAAEFYRHIRRPLESYRALTDLEAPLSEFQHLVRAGHVEAAAAVLRELDQTWLTPRGHARVVVAMRRQLSGLPPAIEMENVAMLGLALMNLGEVQGCREPLHQALGMAEAQGNRVMRLRLLGALGAAAADLGDHQQAVQCAEAALWEARAVGDQEAAAVLGANLGAGYSQMGDYQAAAGRLAEALQQASALGLRSLEMTCCGNLASLHSDQGRLDEAQAWIERALETARAMGSLPDVTMWNGQLGCIQREKGQTELALAAFEEARRQAEQIGHAHLTIMWMAAQAGALLDLGEFTRATALLQDALAQAEAAQDPVGRLQALGGLSAVEIACGALTVACRRLEECLTLLAVAGSEVRRSFWLSRLADVHLMLGNHDAAVPLLAEATNIARRSGLAPALASCQTVQARRLLALGERSEARDAMRAALDLGGGPPVRVGRLGALGRIEHLLGDLDAADRAFSEAMAIPSPPIAYRIPFGLALVRWEQGRLEEANSLLDACAAQARTLLEDTSVLCDPQNVLEMIRELRGEGRFELEQARGSHVDLQLDVERLSRLSNVQLH